MSTNKYDKYLAIFLLVIDTIYYNLIKQLPEDAAKYPLFICCMLGVLSVIFTINSFVSTNISKENIFEGFKAKQFLFVLISSATYIFLIDILGFFVSTIIYLLAVMLGLNADLKLSVISTIIFCLLLYCVFILFLKVPVPTGLLI